MCPNVENQTNENLGHDNAPNTLQACLIDGDADQLSQERRLLHRSFVISVILQIAALAALILFPILWHDDRFALAKTITPIPPYHHSASTVRVRTQPHTWPRQHGAFTFCLTCSPTAPSNLRHISIASAGDPTSGEAFDPTAPTVDCPECLDLAGKTNRQPDVPRITSPKILHVTHLDPAMILRRIDPIYPTLPRQTGRAGQVELRAIIATDGSIRSLQCVAGDPLFYQSALEAVRQWRYKPTFLNGVTVEVDTHVTVIYKFNR